jgi:hypothetical protein
MHRADIGRISRTVFTHPAAPPWFNVVLPEPSIKILYDLPKGAQPIAAENANGPRRRFMVEFRRRTPPRHGADDELKPLPSFSGFYLPARPLGCRQEEHRSRRATAQGFDRSLLALSFAGARLRPTPERRVHSPVGVSRLPSVHHAAGRLSPLRRCGCRRSSLGRRQTHN